MNTLYAILVTPRHTTDSFLLPDGKLDKDEAFQMMQHRAEEYIDEETSRAAELGNDVGHFIITKVSEVEIHIHEYVEMMEKNCLRVVFELHPISF